MYIFVNRIRNCIGRTGNTFILERESNVKNCHEVSRLIISKGRELLSGINEYECETMPT